MRFSFFVLAILAGSIAFAQKNIYLLVGTYTSGKSEGIYVYSFDTSNAASARLGVAKIKNPSYLAISPDSKTVYAVSETSDSTAAGIGGVVAAYHFDNTNGNLSVLTKQYSGGKDPCYVAVDHTGKWIFAGNYSSGTLAVFPIKAGGGIAAASQTIAHTGTGPNKNRQEGPHVHATVISPDNKYLFVPNLGIDKLMMYQFNQNSGKLTTAKQPFAATEPGAGPRHFDFAPNKKFAYLMEELTGTVVAYRYKNGELKKQQRISALADNFTGSIGSADIHVSPDGRFLYCSNRGSSNSITIFSINQQTGALTKLGEQPSLGTSPRNFNFDPSGNFLLVANQQSDNIVIFSINHQTGLLTDTGKRIAVGNPVCVKWIY